MEIPYNFNKPWFNSDVALRFANDSSLLYVNRKKNKDIVDLECDYYDMICILRILHHSSRTFANDDYFPDDCICGMYKVADMYDIPIIRDMVRQRLPEIDADEAYRVALKLDLEKEKSDALARMSSADVVKLVNQNSDFMFSKNDVRGLLQKCNVSGVASPNEQVTESSKKTETWSIPRNFDTSWPTSDTKIRTRDQKELYVNKSVLANFSPYFHAIFMKKSSESKDVFEIDVDHDIFVEILQILHHVDRKFTKSGQKLYDAAMLSKLYTAAVTLDISLIRELFNRQLLVLKPSEAFEVCIDLNLRGESAWALRRMSLPDVTAFLKKTSTSKQLLFSSEDMNEVLKKIRNEIETKMNCRSCNSTNPRTCGHQKTLFD